MPAHFPGQVNVCYLVGPLILKFLVILILSILTGHAHKTISTHRKHWAVPCQITLIAKGL